jgi:hypothetical protein
MNTTSITYDKKNLAACVSQTDNTRSVLFYSLPLEIIEKICSYLDLQSMLTILNINKTDIMLRNLVINSPKLNILKKENRRITTHEIHKYLTSNPSFNKASRSIFLKNINYLSEDPIKQDQAIISVMASADYGMQFALANLIDAKSYAFKAPYEVNLDLFKTGDKTIKCSDFLATSHPNKYLTIINEDIYLFDISTHEKEVVIDNNFLRQNNIIDIAYKVIVKNNFIVIKLNSEEAMLLKKDQTGYKNVTPKNLSGDYDFNNKINAIFTDSTNNTCFIILKNNQVYIYKAIQLLVNDSMMDTYDISDITPCNLKVLEVKASDNNNLTLFYGQNKTTKNLELHVQLNGNTISILNIEIEPSPIQPDNYQFFCNPTGTSFFTTEIKAEIRKCFYFSDIILNRISTNNKLIIHSFHQELLCYYNKNKSEINYINDSVFTISDTKSKDTAVLIPVSKCIHSIRHSSICNTLFIKLFSRFNQTKNLYAIINNKTIYIYNVSANNFVCSDDIVCDCTNVNDTPITIIEERIESFCYFSSVNIIRCKQIAKDVKFSPNSQLIITKEAFYLENQNNNIFNTIRMYSLMRKNQIGEFCFSTDDQLIAEINLHENIQNFDFHPSGLKIIVETDSSIKIIDLIKK